MGPEELAAAARGLAEKHDAKFSVITGEALLKQNFPMIHAVGRASPRAPRLIDLDLGAGRRAQADPGRQGRVLSIPAGSI